MVSEAVQSRTGQQLVAEYVSPLFESSAKHSERSEEPTFASVQRSAYAFSTGN